MSNERQFSSVSDQDTNSDISNKRHNKFGSVSNSPYSSSNRSREKREDIEYPKFKRSNSTNVFHVPISYEDGIKEEQNEEDAPEFSKKFSYKRFSPKTFVPKELLLFDSKTPKIEPVNLLIGANLQVMDPIPEIDDEKMLKNEQLLLKSPRIKFPSDIEEEKIVPKKPIVVSKAILDEEDIIKEEKECENVYEAEEFRMKKNKSMKKYENFIDKEEPPVDLCGLLSENQMQELDEDPIKEEGEVEDVPDKDFQTPFSKRPEKEVIVDEIDEDNKPGRIRTIFLQMGSEEIINESDEYNNINNGN